MELHYLLEQPNKLTMREKLSGLATKILKYYEMNHL